MRRMAAPAASPGSTSPRRPGVSTTLCDAGKQIPGETCRLTTSCMIPDNAATLRVCDQLPPLRCPRRFALIRQVRANIESSEYADGVWRVGDTMAAAVTPMAAALPSQDR